MAFDQTHRAHFAYDASIDKVKLQWVATGNDDVVAICRKPEACSSKRRQNNCRLTQ